MPEGLLPMSDDPATPAEPEHPTHALTTYELRDERQRLASAVAFFSKQDPVPPVRDELQRKLDAVLAQQREREWIAERARSAAHG